MAEFLNSYQFQLQVNNLKLDIGPMNYSFKITDDINHLYSKFLLSLDDPSGLYQETLAFSEGNKISLTFGDMEDTISNNYVITDDGLPENPINLGSIGGRYQVNALHDYYSLLEERSEAFSDRISLIIKDLANEYPFQDVDTNDTGCENIWYCPLMNQEQFIYNVLLPNSFSNNSQNSPFFCFIDSDNNFHFRNYYSMMADNYVDSIIMQPIIASSDSNTNLTKQTATELLRRERIGSSIIKPYQKRNLYSRNRQTGEMSINLDKIVDYPSNSRQLTSTGNAGFLPITDDTKDISQSSYNLYYDESKTGLQEAILGRTINSTKDAFFTERLIIKTPLNVKILAGKNVNINLPLNRLGDQTQSINYSGKYLVEQSNHIWNGKNSSANSIFILSRKFIDISNDNKLKSKFMQGN